MQGKSKNLLQNKKQKRNNTNSISDYNYDLRNMTTAVIDDGITSIGMDTFRDCSKLTCVMLPDSLVSIGYYAFYTCTGLTEITLPNGISSLNRGGVRDCASLTGISLPESWVSIDDNAFRDCTNLSSISLPVGIIQCDGGAFVNTQLKSILVPNIDMDKIVEDEIKYAGTSGSSAMPGWRFNFRYLPSGVTIYCASDAVKAFVEDRCDTTKTTVVCDSSKF